MTSFLQCPYPCIHMILAYLSFRSRGHLSRTSKAHRELLPASTIGIAELFSIYLDDPFTDLTFPTVCILLTRTLLPDTWNDTFSTRDRRRRRVAYRSERVRPIHPRHFTSYTAWADHHFLPNIQPCYVDPIYELPLFCTFGAPSRHRSLKALM